MAQQANLIATYNANPTLQSRYTLDEYLALFDFGTQTPTPDPDPDPTPTPVTPGIPNIINQNIRQGDDGPKGDFGIFGNLDKSTAKDFNVEVYDEEVGDFVPTTITGYKNVNSGLYQDKFGKNLQPAFSNKGQAFGLFGLGAQMLGLTPDTVGGYVPGSIKGYYDGPIDMFKKTTKFLGDKLNFKEKNEIAIQKEKERVRKEAEAKQAIADAEAIERIRQQYAAQGRDYGQGGASQATQDSYAGSDGSYAGQGEASDWGGGEKDGGYIDGSNRRKKIIRSYFNGGIVSLRRR